METKQPKYKKVIARYKDRNGDMRIVESRLIDFNVPVHPDEYFKYLEDIYPPIRNDRMVIVIRPQITTHLILPTEDGSFMFNHTGEKVA